MKLEKEAIIDVAFQVLNEMGLDRFNMRAVAAKLSVSATALYWHFRDKDALLSAMAGSLYGQAFVHLEGHGDWRVALLDFGHALQRAINAQRDGARLCGLAKPVTEEQQARFAAITQPLEQYGLDTATALSYEAVVISFVLGWSIYNQNSAAHVQLAKMFDFDSSFRLGLEATVAGLASHSAAQSPCSAKA